MSKIKEGWQCPICKTVYAPNVESCQCATVQQQPVLPTQTWPYQWPYVYPALPQPYSDPPIWISKGLPPVIITYKTSTTGTGIIPT